VFSGLSDKANDAIELVPAPTPEDLKQARRPQPPFELKASPDRHDFAIRGDAQTLFEQVSKAYGLDVVFDSDYQRGPEIRFNVSEADYRHALYALMVATGSFIVPISDRVFMVVKDTEQKRREVENHIAVSIPIPEPVTIQEAQELGRSVQQLMEIQRFTIDSSQRLIIFRDRASKVRPAEAILSQLMGKRPLVAIEVELLSSAKTTSRALGLSLPTDFPLVPFYDVGRHARTIPSGFLNFLTFGGGKTYLGLGLIGANLLANWTHNSGRSILKAEIRSLDGQPATFHAGDKYPIMTLGYFGTVNPGEEVYRPPPTFNFEDLGLVLKITPKVHSLREVTLDVEAEFKVLGSTTFNGIPVIGNRRFTTSIRLQFDQSAVVAGLLNDTEARTISGLAGTIGIPVLGPLLGRTTTDRDEGEILLTIKPRLLSLPASENMTRQIFIGAEQRLLTPM
jgi:Flp pilus assembly secretin CpaC